MENKEIHSSSFPLKFHCSSKIRKKNEEWDGHIMYIHNYGSHYEIKIESRSGFIFIIGRYAYGAFISIPAFNAGCDLSSYGDYFWNNELLSKIINPVDAATVAEALRFLNKNKYI